MKLIKVNTARIVWLLDTQDLNPRGLDLLPLAIALKERYAFQKLPTLEQLRGAELSSDGLKFKGGAFAPEGGAKFVVDLELYADGLVANTRSDTMHASAFLSDLLTFASQKHGFTYEQFMVKRELRLSEMTVESKTPLDRFEKLNEFSKDLSEFMGGGCQYHLGVVQFWTDPEAPKPAQHGAFRFERLAGASFEDNRFFSTAPVHTDKHLELLDKFEAIMAR